MLNKNLYTKVCFFLIFLIHQIIFQNYLIFDNNYLAEDYKGYVPWMIFGKIWYMNNGLFHLPHFIPSMCGGIPYHADPSSTYLSFMQLLFIKFSIPTALKSTFLIFSFVGYASFFLLCKKCFKFNNFTSLLAATIFVFNGFFTNRILVGHMIYGYYAFLPFYVYLIIKSTDYAKNISLSILAISALVLSSFFYAGASSLMPFVLYSIFLSLAIFSYINKFKFKLVFKNFIISLFITFLLSFSKINYTLSFLNLFPREINIATLDNYFSFVYTFFTSLFLVPDPFFFDKHQFHIDKNYVYLHELEYGVSIVPILIIFYYCIFIKKKFIINKLPLIFLLIILLIPSFLIVELPYLSNILNDLPLISSTWVRPRWLSVYIIPTILISCFILNKIQIKRKFYMFTLILIPICQNYFYIEAKSYFFPEKSFKNKAIYSINNINNFSNNLKYENLDNVRIEYVKNNQNFTRMDLNEGFIINTSEIFCYSPIFGYLLEKLPRNKIINNDENYYEKLSIKKGKYNLFKPMCFLFPFENDCNIGDVFKKNEREELINFSKYKTIKFNKSKIQIVADFIALILTPILLIYIFVSYFYTLIKKKN